MVHSRGEGYYEGNLLKANQSGPLQIKECAGGTVVAGNVCVESDDDDCHVDIHGEDNEDNITTGYR